MAKFEFRIQKSSNLIKLTPWKNFQKLINVPGTFIRESRVLQLFAVLWHFSQISFMWYMLKFSAVWPDDGSCTTYCHTEQRALSRQYRTVINGLNMCYTLQTIAWLNNQSIITSLGKKKRLGFEAWPLTISARWQLLQLIFLGHDSQFLPFWMGSRVRQGIIVYVLAKTLKGNNSTIQKINKGCLDSKGRTILF